MLHPSLQLNRNYPIACLAILTVWLGFPGASMAAENPVINPGFEDEAMTPWEWYAAGGALAEGTLDNTEKHGGKQSLKIHNTSEQSPNVYGQLRQYITGLEPNTTYHFSAWVKGQDVAVAYVGLGPNWETIAPIPHGTFDWVKVEKDFTTGDSPAKYEIVFISGSVTEALWIDDVSVEKAGSKSGAMIFEPAVWKGLPGEAGFFPLLPAGAGQSGLPRVSLVSSQQPSFGGDVQLSCDLNSLFF